MKLIRSVELMGKYAKCPNCGSDLLGNGEGTLEIDEGMFKRTCKCGWKVEVKE